MSWKFVTLYIQIKIMCCIQLLGGMPPFEIFGLKYLLERLKRILKIYAWKVGSLPLGVAKHHPDRNFSMQIF